MAVSVVLIWSDYLSTDMRTFWTWKQRCSQVWCWRYITLYCVKWPRKTQMLYLPPPRVPPWHDMSTLGFTFHSDAILKQSEQNERTLKQTRQNKYQLEQTFWSETVLTSTQPTTVNPPLVMPVSIALSSMTQCSKGIRHSNGGCCYSDYHRQMSQTIS